MMTNFFKRLLSKLASRNLELKLQCLSLDNASLVFNTLMRFFSEKKSCYQILEQRLAKLKSATEDDIYVVIFKADAISKDHELELILNELFDNGLCTELKRSRTSIELVKRKEKLVDEPQARA